MKHTAKGLAILGSTGSVGTQTLDVVRAFPNSFNVIGLAAHTNVRTLESQVREFQPKLFTFSGNYKEKKHLSSLGPYECDLIDMVKNNDVDIVVTATNGDVAIKPTLSAINAGKDIALANKETIVMAGKQVTELAKKNNVSILPLDSEPNAIWQCLRGEEKEVSRIIITASGGAFRDTPLNKLSDVTPEEALQHPTWKMGPKITVDSATMMNKAFEVIEAHWLFDVPWEKIEVVIHPQSMIHSMVEFVDGSVKAQINPPDMRVPIQYALFYPNRIRNRNINNFNPVETGSLTFRPWEPNRYPCFELALETAMRGATWPAVLCGANDSAVKLFLDGEIGYLDISTIIEDVLKSHDSVEDPLLSDLISSANWARLKTRELVGR